MAEIFHTAHLKCTQQQCFWIQNVQYVQYGHKLRSVQFKSNTTDEDQEAWLHMTSRGTLVRSEA